jgi:hypothetical protein
MPTANEHTNILVSFRSLKNNFTAKLALPGRATWYVGADTFRFMVGPCSQIPTWPSKPSGQDTTKSYGGRGAKLLDLAIGIAAVDSCRRLVDEVMGEAVVEVGPRIRLSRPFWQGASQSTRIAPRVKWKVALNPADDHPRVLSQLHSGIHIVRIVISSYYLQFGYPSTGAFVYTKVLDRAPNCVTTLLTNALHTFFLAPAGRT